MFYVLHPYLGDLYDQVNDYEDEIAEQLRFFGERPVTSLNDINNLSMVDDMASHSFSGQEAIKSALEDIKILHQVATEVVKEADANDVWAAVEKFSGHLVAYEKMIYFLRSSNVGINKG